MAVWRTVVRTDYPGTGGPGYNTFHFRDDADGGLNDALVAAQEALRAAYVEISAVMPLGRTFTHDGQWVDINDARIEVTPGWLRASTASTSENLPPATTLCVGWRSGLASRSGRGRTFLSGFGEAQSEGGVPNTAVMDAAAAFGQAIVDFSASFGNGAFVIHSPTTGLSRDITSTATRRQWAVLRSRRD